DLAGPALGRVRAPTLLIVGGNDPQVLDLNRDALEQLRCEKRLHIVPGATHLFEEAGALEDVAAAAADWFVRHSLLAISCWLLARYRRTSAAGVAADVARPAANRRHRERRQQLTANS
ncbi:MAG: alpha/beta hydrolase family protein, partial [Longimicrobiales bacterium]